VLSCNRECRVLYSSSCHDQLRIIKIHAPLLDINPSLPGAQKNYWVYILLCSNQSYYTGYTDNLEKRYDSHLNGTGGCKYTRSFKPLKIAQCWLIKSDKLLAMQLERRIKKFSRQEKLALILNPQTLIDHPAVQPWILGSKE
jgi:putative endonuclease